jgi:NAD dependent epimerase/dehydratase
MKILVTGADGFIGSHLTERLLELGHKVYALSYYNSFGYIGWLQNLKINKNLTIIRGDIRDYEFIEHHLKKVDVVFHLAALISIPHSYRSFNSYIETNINGTSNILAASKKMNIKKIIITSTSEVYGSAKKVPMTEDHPLSAQSPYAATKIAADQISLSFFKSFNLPVTVVRPFNTFGARQSTRAIIPTIITQLFSNGTYIKLGNINTLRDFTYISDTVNGFISVLNSKKIEGEVINVSSGFEISIKNLLTEISKIIGKKKKIIIEKKRVRPAKSEVTRLLGSNSKALKLLKWKPKVKNLSSFRMALKETISWYKKGENLSMFNTNEFFE